MTKTLREGGGHGKCILMQLREKTRVIHSVRSDQKFLSAPAFFQKQIRNRMDDSFKPRGYFPKMDKNKNKDNQETSELVIGGFYEHYKGMRYKVHGVVRHSETLEELVLYETLYENPRGRMWVRPREMFLQFIDLAGVRTPRFRLLNEPPQS